ncbi:S49 family peptidase [Ruixingdingia sedimenti]|uniref:S49 family peptidase n=1 Tax=Ruixingdingia sedimenti TaxID=3073604 RepID=A0ABU1F831_9RHOB|nr:S49 family peptidase [Xinfangfangia sp. LG-4]MDR5653026.1 S49 family peptidase [Xinfangfangia sp. LG-4]
MRRFIPFLPRVPLVPVIRLTGAIGGGARLGGGGMSDAALAPVIERAFALRGVTAVALAVNSPGGSPVQSSLIAARIRRLADEKKIPVHAFVEDAAASGGYWLACAADHIWVDDCSLVGSIGVISASFGLPEFLARNGVERRVHTAGRSKSLGDPFLPEKPEDVARLRAILDPIHDAFIAHVRARRGDRLKADVDYFQGDVWVGARAVDLGLADGPGHLAPKLRALYGDKTRFLPLGQRRPFWRRFGIEGAAARMGAEAVTAALDAAEERAAWARLGL